MKVTYILPISWGGIPHYTAELANAVSKYTDVKVIKPVDSNDDLFSSNLEVINGFKPMYFRRDKPIKTFSLKNMKNFLSYKNLQIVNEMKPDIIHFPELYFNASFFAKLYRLDKKYPTICTLHTISESLIIPPAKSGYAMSFISFISRFMKRLIQCDKIIVHTQRNKDTLIKIGVNQEKIAVIPHGAYSFFKKYEKDHEDDKENCVLLFGYDPEQKGAEYLIKAIPTVSKEISDIKVIIAGEGKLLKSYDLISDKSRFEIYNKFIPNEKVPELFQRAKIVVLPYLDHGGHSGVLTVAFSFGKPVVVTNVGDFPNLVTNNKEGIIVPPRDSNALAEAIIKLLKNEELRKQMGENAHKKAQELSWDNIAKMHMKIYEEVLNERGKRNKD